MLVVCGPTGSGKTTSSHASLSEIDRFVRNVVTIEDPPEYVFDGATQIPVNEAAGMGFANILRSLLRQDPDVIFVGEVRDKETAEIAMQSALTGHFVLTTLHANDAPTTVTRLLDIGIDVSLVQSALSAVLAQRLVRMLCSKCREAYSPSRQELKDLRRSGITSDKVSHLYRAKGCPACGGSGYRGRTGVYELMIVDGAMRQLLVGQPSIESLREAASRGGMKTLVQEAAYKAAKGVTTFDEMRRAVGDAAFEGEMV